MRTPVGGDRSTQWVVQFRAPVTEERLVAGWQRYPLGAEFATSAPRTKTVLDNLREARPEVEWRAIRIESVQRVEDW